MTGAAKVRRLSASFLAVSLVLFAMAACERPRPEREAAQRPAERRVAFTLNGFPQDFRALQRRLRSQYPGRLAPFARPLPGQLALTNLSKQEFLTSFASLDLSASSDSLARALRGNARGFTLDGLRQFRQFRANPYPISVYAKEVAAQLGPIPSFNVFEQGVVIPITLNNVEVPAGQHSPSGTCDRPVLLKLGGDGQCVPYSRIGRLPGTNPQTGQPDPDIQWVFIARRYRIRTDPNHPLFEDVAIIGHNTKTGATAFFQMLDKDNGKSGIRVPSPMESAAQTPAGFPTAQDFWLAPEATAKIGCNTCHDSDPFVHSPYVNQVLTTSPAGTQQQLVPSDPAGHYTFIGTRAFTAWSAPQHFDPENNRCTGCHRMGVNKSSGLFASWATGTVAPQQSGSFGSYPASHWMPPEESDTLTPKQWEDTYRNSVLQLISCYQGPSQAACNRQAIP